jgi:hypothetical protein
MVWYLLVYSHVSRTRSRYLRTYILVVPENQQTAQTQGIHHFKTVITVSICVNPRCMSLSDGMRLAEFILDWNKECWSQLYVFVYAQ